MSIAQVCILPIQNPQLSRLLRFRHVDVSGAKSLQIVFSEFRVHDVKSPVGAIEPLSDEWQQDSILFIAGVEERANVAMSG